MLLCIASLYATAVFAQQRDPRVREYITPTRIVWMQGENQITHPEYLLREGVGQADLTNSHICVMRSTKESHPAILLDFGRELHGALQIVTGMPGDHTPVKVRIRFINRLADAVIDQFGKDTMLIPDGEDHFNFTVKVAVSPMFLSWVIGFGAKARILYPQSVVDRCRELCQEAMSQY